VPRSKKWIKDLVFPGNLQEIMNRVLAAERMSEAQLVEARTKAEVQRIDAESKAAIRRVEQEAQTQAERDKAQVEADIQRIKTEADIRALLERAQHAQAYEQHPAMLRLIELETLQTLSTASNARIYVTFGRAESSEVEERD
jgi:regulator of protease activity HflC (stomatin/prohibitin superfamily)